MPMSGTGRPLARGGYTLIEVLAVITLLGFILAVFAAPDFFLNEERADVQSIGRLIASDLKTAESEARLYKMETAVNFAAEGYTASLGETEIKRHFNDFHFRFQISGTAPAKSPSPESGNLKTEPAGTPDDSSPSQLILGEDGLTSDFTLDWATDHFKGTLQVGKDGSVAWRYERI